MLLKVCKSTFELNEPISCTVRSLPNVAANEYRNFMRTQRGMEPVLCQARFIDESVTKYNPVELHSLSPLCLNKPIGSLKVKEVLRLASK